MIKVIYACNDRMFDGLYLSILSILRRTKESINFYLLTGDFSEIDPLCVEMSQYHINLINKLVKKFGEHNKFTVINCEKEYKSYLPRMIKKPGRYGPYANLSLLLDLYSDFNDKVIFLDTDTMACGDIKELYDVDVNKHQIAVCHNKKSIRWYQRKGYFNSGVILFNMPECKRSKLFEKCRDLVQNKKLISPNQTALYLAADNKMFFPDNEYRFNNQSNKIHENDIIKHFIGSVWSFLPFVKNIKQWNVNIVKRKYPGLFDEDYKIFLETKEELKNEMKNEYYVDVRNLRKSYGDLKAVDNISFKVKKGSLFAFLGVNGAGKSTTINIICSTLPKDSGEIFVDAFDLEKENSEVKKRIGIVFQNSVLDNNLTVEENLIIRGKFYNLKKEQLKKSIDKVVKMLKLEPIMKQPVEQLSGGQRRRVDIARALIHEPQLLILDEPTTGLDPKTRIDVWNLIDDIRMRTKMTVFLTTHYLEEAEKASYIVIINKGKIIAEGTANELKNKYSSDYVISYQKKNSEFEKIIKKYKFSYDNDLKAYKICVNGSLGARTLLEKYKEFITDFEIKKGNMDDVFLRVTGEIK